MPRKSNAVQEMAQRVAAAKRSRYLWIHRPIFVHRRHNSGSVCICGCNSRRAHAVEEQEHIDLLVDRKTGQRWLLQQVEQKEKWHGLAAIAERVDVPLRAHPRQLDLILDKRHKVVAAFGGERGGKTSFVKEWLADFVFLEGGPGTTFWWVAPEREKTQIGVDMLFRGYATDRWVPPVFPKAYQAYYPETFLSANQRARLIDGTEIPFLHAGKTGRNLKGRPAKGIVVDEGCEIDHESNWQTLLGRTMDAGANIAFASTPVLGSWAKEQIADVGITLEEAAEAESEGKHVHTIAEKLTCFENPWLGEREIEETILAKAATSDLDEAKRDPAVRREVFGEWVGEGDLLWRHFRDTPDPKTKLCHLRDGPARDVSFFGLDNITRVAYANHFRNTGAKLDQVCGLDFNVGPNHAVIVQVGCPRGLDQQNRDNWILFVADEIVVNGTNWELGRFLNDKAPKIRGLPMDAYSGMAIVADGTGGNRNPPKEQGPYTKTASTPFKVMEELGFHVKPPKWHKATPSRGAKSRRHPANPGRKDAVDLMHLLMRSSVTDLEGKVWPRLMIRVGTCPHLVDVLQTQEAGENGLPIKRSHSQSDRDCGIVEALWYVAWPAFAGTFRRTTTTIEGF